MCHMKKLRTLMGAVLGLAMVCGAGCASPALPSAPTALKGQSYSNDTYKYSFVAPEAASVSAPQNFMVGASFSQQVTWVYLGEGTAISINVFLNGKSASYDKAKVEQDPSFKRMTVNGNDAWQSDDTSTPGYQVLTTVFFGDSYIYEVQYGGPTLSDADRASYGHVINGFTLTK